jgi:DNA-binding beta-propeller fold protein YncE
VGYQRKLATQRIISLPTSKLLFAPAVGNPQITNGFPVTIALHPSGRYLALLNAGYGAAETGGRQSIAILDLETNSLTDFPDDRLGKTAHQSFFLGLAFSLDGSRLFATVGSITDPTGRRPENTGNGIAEYRFDQGRISSEHFLPVYLQSLAPGKRPTAELAMAENGKAIPYPAGLAVFSKKGREQLLIANNLSDNAVLFDISDRKQIQQFDLSMASEIPTSFPYTVIVTRDGHYGFCSLWNASSVAEIDLRKGKVRRQIPLLKPESRTASGSHPTAMLLSPDEKLLYVTLSNSDAVAVVDIKKAKLQRLLSTRLPGQEYGGTFPNALALSADGRYLFVANASSDAIAVFDISSASRDSNVGDTQQQPMGFIPAEWYPTAIAVRGDDLLIASGKGEGTGPNGRFGPGSHHDDDAGYIPTLLHGSIARVSISKAIAELPELTQEVEQSNLMKSDAGRILFASGSNPIHHVIYIIRENRTYDQVFGDLKPGDGDPSLCMYCEDITPNQHRLGRQFGIIDNFYDSGEVSGDGHMWSTAAITSDYNEKTWQIAYRGKERTYDFEGVVGGEFPLHNNEPDVNEPQTGYLWGNIARHGLSYRHYGEFVATVWCGKPGARQSPKRGTPLPDIEQPCDRGIVRKGEPLPPNVGQPHGSPSPWPWPLPIPAHNIASKPELRGHYDPNFADFRVDYPDQLRVDEFLNEFEKFVRARQEGNGEQLPAFVLLRLPDDHTGGTRPGFATPSASVADNDLALGRVVEAVSHSPYWDDTAILMLEDDAQDGADHVDAHRSLAFVISKYSPGSEAVPYVDHHFYTTVSMIHTMEMLLGLPPMNNNDALAPVMAPLFSGSGQQPPFTADYCNRDNGIIYEVNPPHAPGADESMRMDFSHADAADAGKLNAILWRDRMGNRPMPVPKHNVFGTAARHERD